MYKMLTKEEYEKLLKKHPDSFFLKYTDEERWAMMDYMHEHSPDLFNELTKPDKKNVA